MDYQILLMSPGFFLSWWLQVSRMYFSAVTLPMDGGWLIWKPLQESIQRYLPQLMSPEPCLAPSDAFTSRHPNSFFVQAFLLQILLYTGSQNHRSISKTMWLRTLFFRKYFLVLLYCNIPFGNIYFYSRVLNYLRKIISEYTRHRPEYRKAADVE